MLLQKGAEIVEERDFFQERFSEDELRRLIGGRSLAEVFSWNSPSFKAMGLKREELDDGQLLRLMLDEPRLIRRPLVQVGEQLIIGADRKALERLLEGHS